MKLMNYSLSSRTLILAGALAVGPAALGQQAKPRVYINGTGNVDVQTNAGVVGGSGWAVGSSHSTVGAHNQTMELAKDFPKQCPDVTVTLNGADADYTVGMNHEAFHGLIHKNNQIMVANRRGDLVFSNTTRAVSHSVNDSCAAILTDWKANGRIEMPTAPAPVSAPPAPPAAASAQPQAAATQPATVPPPAAMQVIPGEPAESLDEVARRMKAKRAAAASQQQKAQALPPKDP
jgi:hypothetical protein